MSKTTSLHNNVVSIPFLIALAAFHWIMSAVAFPNFQIKGVTLYSGVVGIAFVLILSGIYTQSKRIEFDAVKDHFALKCLKYTNTFTIYGVSDIIATSVLASYAFEVDCLVYVTSILTLFWFTISQLYVYAKIEGINHFLKGSESYSDLNEYRETRATFVGSFLTFSVIGVIGLLLYSWIIDPVQKVDKLVSTPISAEERKMFVANADKISKYDFSYDKTPLAMSTGLLTLKGTKISYSSQDLACSCGSGLFTDEHKCLKLAKDYITVMREYIKATLPSEESEIQKNKEIDDLYRYFKINK